MPRPTAPRGGSYRVIYSVVSRIPQGRVATYGQVARLAGMPGQARLVGYALHALPEGTAVPWQRVVSARGATSPRADGSGHETLQRLILRREGVRLGPGGSVSLERFQWQPALEGPPARPTPPGGRRR